MLHFHRLNQQPVLPIDPKLSVTWFHILLSLNYSLACAIIQAKVLTGFINSYLSPTTAMPSNPNITCKHCFVCSTISHFLHYKVMFAISSCMAITLLACFLHNTHDILIGCNRRKHNHEVQSRNTTSYRSEQPPHTIT